ncbi:hypothetical protein D3C75_594010 [compost metagenome]
MHKIPCIQIVIENRRVDIGQVIHHIAADPLQSDKCIRLAVCYTNLDILRLRTFFGAPFLKNKVVIGPVEALWNQSCRNLLKVRSAVVDERHILRIPDRERTCAEQIGFPALESGSIRAHLIIRSVKGGHLHIFRGIAILAFAQRHILLVDIAVPVPGIPFIRRDHIGFTS